MKGKLSLNNSNFVSKQYRTKIQIVIFLGGGAAGKEEKKTEIIHP